ncbi:hypothetical protein HPB52_008215 [Rhipicephalus sanguineus]|uniref:Uncharacterized protein n=1 Tax=Rhipicephalus sanguineus TaxID=34632 RepID=A0A9D4PRB4_RHISA|nr:hypothetical protein HPB52_008215 [Rhipicephalus sanguineus]
MIRACIVLALATSAFAGYTGGFGYGLGLSHYGLAHGIGYSGLAVTTTTVHHAAPVATAVATPAIASYHAAPVYGYGVGTLGYGAGHYGFGHGLLGYGLNYGYGLGSAYDYTALLRRKKSATRPCAHEFLFQWFFILSGGSRQASRSMTAPCRWLRCRDGDVPINVVTGGVKRGDKPKYSGHVPRPAVLETLYVGCAEQNGIASLLLRGLGEHRTRLQEYERIHDEGSVTTYQCYRNGTTLEPPTSRNFTVLWRSADQPENEAQCVCTFVLDGGSEEQRIEVSAEYNEQEDYGILSGHGASAYLYQLQPPFQGEAYYFKEVAASTGHTVFKIYDTDETCTNAKALHDQVCPEPCDLEFVR